MLYLVGAETTLVFAQFSLSRFTTKIYVCVVCICPIKLNLLLEPPRVVNGLNDIRAIGVEHSKLYQVYDFIMYADCRPSGYIKIASTCIIVELVNHSFIHNTLWKWMCELSHNHHVGLYDAATFSCMLFNASASHLQSGHALREYRMCNYSENCEQINKIYLEGSEEG